MDDLLGSLGARIPLGAKQQVRRRTNRLRLGMLHRAEPFSEWSRSRGTPIDRIYVEEFLAANRAAIRGRVLEVRDAQYTRELGAGVTQSEVLDIDASNAQATVVGDLAAPNGLPVTEIDCFILTQTLQYVSDPRQAIANCHNLLSPGGVLLATVPTITRIDSGHEEDIDRWRFTARACVDLFGGVFGESNTTVTSHGNLLAAVAFLAGLAAEEFAEADLRRQVPEFQMVVTVRAEKNQTAVAE
jgi:SAM-dependent methyltransferase